MTNETFYAMTFFATGDTIQSEKKIREKFNVTIIPTPREISTSCGFAIRFSPDLQDEKQMMDLQEEIMVNCDLYHLGAKGEDGKRRATLVASCRV